MTRYALDRAADHLRDDLRRYKIEVPKSERTFVRRGMVTPVSMWTPYSKCLSILRAAIREEKKLVEEKLMENQGRLL